MLTIVESLSLVTVGCSTVTIYLVDDNGEIVIQVFIFTWNFQDNNSDVVVTSGYLWLSING